MGAAIFRDHVYIGDCSLQICACVNNGSLNEGCMNFIPKPNKETPMALSLTDKLLTAINEGLAHFGYPALDKFVTGAITRRVARVVNDDSAAELGAAAHRAVIVADEWMCKYTGTIPFVDKAELIAKLTQAIENKPALQVAMEEVAQTGCTDCAKPEPVDRYCVVGIDAYQRTYYTDPVQAEAAAAKMLASNIRRQATTSGVTPKKLLVVKAVSVIEPSPPIPPEHIVRAPTEEDFRKRTVVEGVRRRPWED
jgi:hypothetical protein